MEYNELLKKVEQGLFWLDANARHAIELHETFAFPAYEPSIRALIKGTNKVRCYKICLDAIYFEFVMTLMRMYDSYERDTICLKTLFEYLSDSFVQDFEAKTRRKVENEIQSARKEFKSLNGSHLVGRLRTVRNNMFAHTSPNFSRNQVAKYGHAEKLLKRTLPMLNSLNSAIGGKAEPYDKVKEYWKKYSREFWQTLLSKDS
ncbi:MAG: hypothetical protein JRF50_13610 [Deltaproteobacteria bacterium]|nr:hypothetical protein [Deltaproteobacteria bacterium]